MMETLLFLATPFAACVILVLILCYFGNHILSRGVIFVDIAVAQVAALGTMIGILLGASEGSLFSLLISLGFTLIIVSAFAVSKFQHKELSQEVIIGIIYCMALAIAYLLVDSVPGGSNFVQKTFTGAILWVTWSDILKTGLLFAVVGIVHLLIYQKTLAITENRKSEMTAAAVRLYDLIFYITFGFVVVESVKIGGIFVVFMFLIGPAAIAMFLASTWRMRFLLSWSAGLVGSFFGILLSYKFNFPNGPTIVCILGAMLLTTALVSRKRVNQTSNT
ncbi:metal ABC transporter permease [candidate division KSB1 bacterium]|nr:metal ABC transporter permease [candidate division KSB1 bacterium]RQW03840.1 MAG: metal ABC transporter permease [candidate division KSB1 bacterium]